MTRNKYKLGSSFSSPVAEFRILFHSIYLYFISFATILLIMHWRRLFDSTCRYSVFVVVNKSAMGTSENLQQVT